MAHLMRALQRYSCYTVDKFTEIDLASDPHKHPIYPPDTTEPEGFPSIDPNVDQDIWTDTMWQFALSDEKGTSRGAYRVHGFIYQDVFYIVWLDPRHLLDPTDWVEKRGKKQIRHAAKSK